VIGSVLKAKGMVKNGEQACSSPRSPKGRCELALCRPETGSVKKSLPAVAVKRPVFEKLADPTGLSLAIHAPIGVPGIL
jgi:hypothetical protein